MKRILSAASAVVLAIALFAASPGFGADPAPSPEQMEGGATAGEKAAPPALGETQVRLKVPLFSPLFAKVPVAAVNDEPILMQELVDAVASAHEMPVEGKAAGKKDYLKVLDRLVNIRLMLLEAANMGIDELPEIKKEVEAYAATHLRDMLKQRQLKDVKPDPELVERFYREAVKEWKIRSVKLDKEEDARAMAKEIEAGGDFAALADKYVAEGKAEGGKEGEYLKPQSLLPQVADAVSAMKVGSVSPVIPIGPAFTILKLEDIRYPAGNVEAREAAESQALDIKRREVLRKYFESLKKKYVTIDQKLLKKLDFEAAKPGFGKLLKDKRAVARMKGEKSITVADIAEGISQKFFHGVEQAIKEKKVNQQIQPVLEEKIYELTFTREAKKLGIDKTEEYRKDIGEFKESIVFGLFIQKVVAPDVKAQEDEIKAYYDEHIKEYTAPAMAKLQGLVFTRKNYAEDALDKLKKGTDFQWVKNNAEGQVDKKTADELLQFSGRMLVLKDFPEAMQKAIADAKSGDLRIYASPDGYFFTLQVQDMIPPRPAPLETVKKEIIKKVIGTKMNKAVEQWGEKLRKEYPVTIFITD